MNRSERRRAAATGQTNHAAALQDGFARHQAGDLRQAEAIYRQALARSPDEPEALRLLGEVLIDLGRPDEAVSVLRRFAARLPGHFVAHYSLGNGYRIAGRMPEAIAAYQASIRLNPKFAGARHGLAAALLKLGREDEAAQELRAAVAAEPGWAVAWVDLGTTLAALGALEEAADALARALALQPGLSEARRHLAALKPDALPAAVAARADDPRVPAAERIDTKFALGRVAEKAGQYDAAFGHFAAANALLRTAQVQAGIKYDRARMAGDVDRLIAAFPAEFFARQSGARDSELPVFIVGMPRAGSSLFEQIAASHTQVFGAGERKGIGVIAQRLGWAPSALWTAENLGAAAAGYLAEMQGLGGDAARIIDKMPDNVFQLGLIATLFPAARVVFCERDARDICLSCFFQHFAEPYAFDTDLLDCAHRYREVARLMAHWRQVLPLPMMTLSYDTLVADLECEARRLIAFLGLDWEPACLQFFAARRVVRTASWAQVRQPLYQRSSGQWRHYERHLGPLIAALEA